MVQPGEMPYRLGHHLQGRGHGRLRSGRLPRRPRARARAPPLPGAPCPPGRAAPDAPADRHRRRLLRPGLRHRALRGRAGPRRPERPGLRDHRGGRAGPGPPDHARPDLRGGARRARWTTSTSWRATRSSSPSAWAPAAAASRRTPGPAVARTTREVRARAQQVAAELLECAPEDVRIEEGRAFVAGVPGRCGHPRPDRPRGHPLEGPPQDRGARPPATAATSTRTP